MSDGREVMGQIDAAVESARARAAQASAALSRAQAAHEAAQSAVVAHTRELARLRMDLLAARQVIERIDVGDQRAMQLVDARGRELTRIAAAIEASLEAQRRLTQERDARLADFEAADAAVADCFGRADSRLAADPAHAQRAAQAAQAAARAEQAAAKATQAEADRDTKRRPYESEPLFMYLWRRRFHFPEYRAGTLVRAVDRWVAGLCGYEQAHRDYRMLLELADRLRAHATALAADATARRAEIDGVVEQARLNEGAAALRDALNRAGARHDAAEQALEAEEARHAALLESRASIAEGRDPMSQEALTVLQARMSAEGIDSLIADARSTASPRDDRMVERLADLRTAADAAARGLAGLIAAQEQSMRELREVEALRQQYRAKGYDAAHSEFRDGFAIGVILDGVLRGALRGGDAWEQVRRHQRFRRPSKPGGGFGTGGGFGGGGFRTGGGLGGGGFKTGGGF